MGLTFIKRYSETFYSYSIVCCRVVLFDTILTSYPNSAAFYSSILTTERNEVCKTQLVISLTSSPTWRELSRVFFLPPEKDEHHPFRLHCGIVMWRFWICLSSSKEENISPYSASDMEQILSMLESIFEKTPFRFNLWPYFYRHE